MTRRHCVATGYMATAICTALLCIGTGFPLHAQETASPPLRPRKLAPGVLTVIPPEPKASELFSGPRPLPEITKGVDPRILNWEPNFSPKTDTLGYKAQQVVIRSGVWHLEFSFKPLRMIEVDLPHPSGQLQRKQVWYMVYRLRNLGYHQNPSKGHFVFEGSGADRTAKWQPAADRFGHSEFGVDRVNRTVRFFPRFVLMAHDVEKRYLDQLVPLAIPLIQKREDPAIKLYDSVNISTVEIEVSDDRIDRSVWGVVTWMDLDPKIDFFSIYIQGLTNAYKFEDDLEKFKLGSPPLTGRKISTKTLQLCFWRPGDELLLNEREVRYGMPFFSNSVQRDKTNALYGVEERIDYRWFYPNMSERSPAEAE